MSLRQAGIQRPSRNLSLRSRQDTGVIQTNSMKSHHFSKAVGPIVILCLWSCFTLFGQTPPKPETQGMGGVVTGTPVNYSSRRTVGITDPKAPLIFEDATDKTALANFKHRSGTPAKDYIFEVPSGGVAIFDYDGDGLSDIYLVNGSTLPALLGKEKPPRAALFHNLGNWKFEDMTDKAGVANERWGMGVAGCGANLEGLPGIFIACLLGVPCLQQKTVSDVGEPAVTVEVARHG